MSQTRVTQLLSVSGGNIPMPTNAFAQGLTTYEAYVNAENVRITKIHVVHMGYSPTNAVAFDTNAYYFGDIAFNTFVRDGLQNPVLNPSLSPTYTVCGRMGIEDVFCCDILLQSFNNKIECASVWKILKTAIQATTDWVWQPYIQIHYEIIS